MVGALVTLAFAAPPLATAADLGVSSAKLGTATIASPPFHATRVSSADGGGGGKNIGDLGQGDRLVLTFSAPLAASSVCPSFTGTSQAGYTVRVTNTSPADLLTVIGGPASCTPGVASISLGSTGHVSGTATFSNSSLQLTLGGTVLTLTLGTLSGSATTRVTSNTVLTATPDAALRDTSNRAVSAGTASSLSGVQF